MASAIADGWEVVDDQHYSLDTQDFAPIVTAVLATNPDVVSLNLSYPSFVVQNIEQLYSQGFKGAQFRQLPRHRVDPAHLSRHRLTLPGIEIVMQRNRESCRSRWSSLT